MKRLILAVALAAAVIATVAACTPQSLAKYDCLNTGRIIYDVPSNHITPWPHSAQNFPDGSAVDARGEVWDNSVITNGSALGIKYRAGMGANLCHVGATISTTIEPEDTAWSTWHGVVGLNVENDGMTVIGANFTNQGDAIAFFGADDWSVIGVRADGGGVLPGAYIHDDCIENDTMKSGLVDDSKFDGCNVFMSSNSGADGSGKTVEVRNTLVRLQPFRNSYNTAKYGENQHGGFFKWSNPLQVGAGTPPHLIVRDSVFRADQRGVYGGNANGFLGLPPGTECDNVTLIGSEVWRATDVASWTSQCTNLTFATVAEWDQRVAEWDAAHPRL